ncbi:MAG: hypothetical protein JST26_02510 [Bacteroidetes bacterium]|nr:hypothetical protein [Bacteroidota bacterium]
MKHIFTLCLFIVAVFHVKAQDIDSLTLSKMKLNFVVPDIPAFKSVNADPSNILRPSTPKAFAVAFSKFYDNKTFVIPKDFAMEIAPVLLIRAEKPVTLQKYLKHQVINNIRISLATSTDTALYKVGRSMAVGLRVSLINKGDLATDTVFHHYILRKLDQYKSDARKVHMREFAKDHGISTDSVDWDYTVISKYRDEFAKYLETKWSEQYDKEIEKFKSEYKKNHWNAVKLDFATSVTSSSPDTLIKNILFKKCEAWMTLALPAGKNAQVLIGANYRGFKNLNDTMRTSKNNFYSNVSIPVRYLVGTNRVKGFAETQYQYASGDQQLFLFNMGSEFNVYDGIWVNLYGGVNYNSTRGTSTFVANFNLKMSFPEKFRFF